MDQLKINTKKFKNELPKMTSNSIKSLIKSIYDEKKHNRKMSESQYKELKELEKKSEEELKKRKVINEKTQADYNEWKKKMDKERRCY